MSVDAVEQLRSAVDSQQGDGDAANRPLLIEHDFGFLRAGASTTHTFTVRNDSVTTWTVERVKNTCSCTVAEVSLNTLEPDESLSVTVDYRAPQQSVNDRRRVSVYFHQPDAPPVHLRVLATVRKPMTVQEHKASLLNVGTGKTCRASFEVENYSETDWRAVDVSSPAPWLTFAARQVATKSVGDGFRELWIVEVTADASDLDVGEHLTAITVRAVAANGEVVQSSEVPSTTRVTASFGVVPRHLFFGEVNTTEPATAKLTVFFSEDAIPLASNDVQFEHQLGDALSFTWLKTGGRVWKLQATLLSSSHDLKDQSVSISLRDHELSTHTLPIHAFKSDKQVEEAREE